MHPEEYFLDYQTHSNALLLDASFDGNQKRSKYFVR